MFKSHLESSSPFKGLSKTVQNELLDCMLDVFREEILAEIEGSEFISVLADETTDISEKFQLVIVVRYCNKEGKAMERFWGFFNPTGQDANSISECILSQLETMLKNKKDKLFRQNCDGVSVMSGILNGVQAKVRDCYKYVYFVHCYGHQLYFIMERAAKQNTKARIFFANLSSIPAFFSLSPHRQSVLDSCVSKRIPSAGATRWNFKVRTVNTVHEKKEPLLECFKTLMESETSNNITINEASALVHTLEDSEFNF